MNVTTYCSLTGVPSSVVVVEWTVTVVPDDFACTGVVARENAEGLARYPRVHEGRDEAHRRPRLRAARSQHERHLHRDRRYPQAMHAR